MNIFSKSGKTIHTPRFTYLLTFIVAWSVLWLSSAAQQPPQDDVPLAPRRVLADEAFRIRVENIPQGSISISIDGGLHYALIGRVTRPAATVLVDQRASAPGVVLRSSNDGIAFAVNLGQVLKLLPDIPGLPSGKRVGTSSRSEVGAITTNLAPRTGIFADLLPPPGAQARLEIAPRTLRPFPTLYDPQQDEPIVIVVARTEEDREKRRQGEEETGKPGTGNGGQGTVKTNPQPMPPSILSPQLISDRVMALEQAYRAQSLARARQERRPVVSGILSLKAKLPAGEPDPIAYVNYVVDNHIVSSQNVPPFNFEWDTRQETEGEHLVEVRALNRNSHIITSRRTLLFVQNKAN